MQQPDNDISALLQVLQQELDRLIAFYQKDLDFDAMVYERWNAKDILGHLVFWHESFARNIRDLGQGRKPNPLKGKLSAVNQQSVETTSPYPIAVLIERLRTAQVSIEQHIFNEQIDLIPYKRGSRPYPRWEHLKVVAQHIRRHRQDLEKKFKVFV